MWPLRWWCRLGKTNPRSETRTERFGSIPNQTSEIGLPESKSETRIDPSRTMPDLKFFTKLLIFLWQAYWTKNRLTRRQSEPKFTQPKSNQSEMSLNLKHDPTQTEPNSYPNWMTHLLGLDACGGFPWNYALLCSIYFFQNRFSQIQFTSEINLKFNGNQFSSIQQKYV